MATNTVAEGLVGLRVSAILASAATTQNSLDGLDVTSIVNGTVAYVVQTDREYRWYAFSTTTPSYPDVVLPLGQFSSQPGRWVIIPLPGFAPPPGDSLNQVLTWDPVQEAYLPKGRIATYVIPSLEALEAAFPAVDGVHTIGGGVVEFQGDEVDLGSNRIEVTGPAKLQGWDTTIISTTATAVIYVTATGVTLRQLGVRNANVDNAGVCLAVNIADVLGKSGVCVAHQCKLGTFVAGDAWGLPAAVGGGMLKLNDCDIGDTTVYLTDGGLGVLSSAVLTGCTFWVNSTTAWGVEVQTNAGWVRLDSCEFKDSRAGMVRVMETGSCPLLEVIDCVEGYEGSLSNFAVYRDPASFSNNSNTVVSGCTLAGGVGYTPNEFASLQVLDNRFVSHQNTRVPFAGFTASDLGINCRSNYDLDTFAYLPETALVP